MAQRVRIRRTVRTKSRVRKGSNSGGYRTCNMCHGTGKVKVKS